MKQKVNILLLTWLEGGRDDAVVSGGEPEPGRVLPEVDEGPRPPHRLVVLEEVCVEVV